MTEWWGAGFAKTDMDGLVSWVGEELEGLVMEPVGEGQDRVDWIMEDKSRTVLRRGNKEQLPTPQVKSVCLNSQWWQSSCCFEEHVFPQKKIEAHRHIFYALPTTTNTGQRILSMSSVMPLEIVFCQGNPHIIPKCCCNWHGRSAETGGGGLCAMRGKIWYVTCTTSKCLSCVL